MTLFLGQWKFFFKELFFSFPFFTEFSHWVLMSEACDLSRCPKSGKRLLRFLGHSSDTSDSDTSISFLEFSYVTGIHGKSPVIRWSDHQQKSNFWGSDGQTTKNWGGDGQNCVKTPKNLGWRRTPQNWPPAATWAFPCMVTGHFDFWNFFLCIWK